ncbi:MAG: FtsQ-type POTRA domain-containing protein [Candidatus Gastranaerophilales bacterium]|nr:FtsQ-type POTRA domain-containing protein [Candidatus Gastranaerophilales bacterium]MCM1073237.1 FtsQ-type POTRA domain-containing protein [Bacteroides sp.]
MSDEELKSHRDSQARRLKQAQMQRQIRRSQRRLNRLRAWYKFFLIMSLIALGFFILKLPQWRLHSNAFDSLNNPQLEIVNNRIVPSQKVLSALRRNQVPKQPVFLVKTENLKKSIKQLEPIQDVYIRRFWFPARLQIIVIERTPIVTISPNTDVPPIAFFSADGKLIGREYMPLADDYKTVLVITYGTGDDYRNWDVAKVNNFKKLAMLTERETGETVEYIDYRNPKDVYMKIPTANVRLGSINPSTFDKIQRLPSLLPQVKMINKKVKYIDLRWDSNYIKLDE